MYQSEAGTETDAIFELEKSTKWLLTIDRFHCQAIPFFFSVSHRPTDPDFRIFLKKKK